MTGYQETLTDPSYHRQVVVMTAPHIGNTGINDEDPESARIWVAGYVVRDPARVPVSWRSRRSLDDELRGAGRGRHLRHRHPRADPAPARARGDAGRHLLDRDRPAALLERVRGQAEMAGAELAERGVDGGDLRRARAMGREAADRRRARPRHQGDDPAPDGRARHRGARAARHRDHRRRAGVGRRRALLLQRPRRPGGDDEPGRAAAAARWPTASPTSASASATSCSAGRSASAPTSSSTATAASTSR